MQGGTITGVVTSATAADASGKKVAGTPLPGVTVTATNTLTGKKYTAATDVTGAFQMSIPRNGRYVLRAEFAAFAPATSEVLLNATQHTGKAEFALELASRVAARNAATGTGTAVAVAASGAGAAGAQARTRGLQSLNATGSADADTEAASLGDGGGDTSAIPALTSLSGDSGSDSVAISGQNGQINGLAGFNEDDMRNRIQDAIQGAQRTGGDVSTAVVGMVGNMAMGGPQAFGGGGGPFNGPADGFGGGPGGGGAGGFGGGGFAGGAGGFGRGGFRNFNPAAVHGNVYYQGGNAALDATQFSLTGVALKPAYSTNQYGLALSGSPYIPGLTKPDTRQNLFLNWTGQRNQTPQNIYNTVPTLLQRTGNFNGLTQAVSGVQTPVILYNPATGQPYGNCSSYLNPTCNVITGPLSPQATALLQYIPTPNTDIASGNTDYNYQRITTAGNNSSQISARFTRSLGAVQQQQGRGGRGGGGGGRGGGGRNQQTQKVLRQNISANFAYSHTASDSRGLTPTLDGKTASDGYNATAGYNIGYGRISNNMTFGWNATQAQTVNNFTFSSNDPAAQAGISIPRPAGVQAGLYNGVPALSLTNFASISDVQPSIRHQETFSFSDVFSYRKGKHNMRFGVDVRRLHNDLIAGSNGIGQFTFTGYATQNPNAGTNPGTPTGSSFADFLLGAPQNSAIQAGTNKIYLREWAYDGYANDDWRLTSNITVNVGLRYEYFSPYIEENNRLVNLDHNATFTQFARVLPDGVGPYSGAFPRSLVQPDRSLWSPRLGLAYRPKFLKNTVVRVGYGINYNLGQLSNFANSLSYQAPFAVSQNNVALIAGTASQGCGNLTTAGTTGSTFTLANAFNCTSSTVLQNTFAINRAYRLGRVQVVNMDIQHTLPMGIVMNVGYNASLGSSLDLRRAPNRDATAVTSNAQGIIYEDSIGESRFNALNVSVRKRMQKGIALAATYQYGHSIDDASSIGGVGANTVVQNDARIVLEFGNSSFDVRHQVTGTYVLELPFGPNRAFLNRGGWASHMLDGFNLSGAFTFATGTYATPQYQNSVAQASTGNNFTLRPDRVFSQPIKGAGQLRNWFNPAAFTTPAAVFGTASRNSIELPGTVSNNMSLSRTIRLGDIRNLEMRLTANNVFNTVQYSGVNTTLNNANFGQITGAANPRKIIYQVRYRF